MSKDGAGHPGRWRSIVAVVLVVFAAVLAPLTITAIWVRDRILDTDGYVATVAPLAENEAVTDAIAARVVNELFAAADVQDRLTDVLPGPVDALGRTLTNSLRGLATTQAERVLESDAFEQLWERANRAAHKQVVAMFSGRSDAVSNEDNTVVLDLGIVADKVRQRLVDEGVGILRRVSIPEDSIEITLFKSDLVGQLQTTFRILDDLATVLPVLLVAAIVGAIAVAPHRRRILVGLGLGIAASTALLSVGIDLARRITVDQASSASLNTEATKAVFDTLVVALRDWSWYVIAAGIFVAVVALVANPGLIGRVADRMRGSSPEIPPAAAWAHAHLVAVCAAVLGAALVVLVVWPTPTLLVVALVVLVTALALATVIALTRMRARSSTSDTPEQVT